MFIHHVFFWLKEDLSAEEVQNFEAGAKSLLQIDSVEMGDLGKPSVTDRPVIERSYSYSLMLAFKDKEGHDLYQPHDIHTAFVESCAQYWSRVLIYDSETV